MAHFITTKSISSPYTQRWTIKDTFSSICIKLLAILGPQYSIRRFFYIQSPKQKAMPLNLYKFQEKLITSWHTHLRSINMLSRQSGKTDCMAAYLLWYAMCYPNKTILVVGHNTSAAQEIMLRIRHGYETWPNWAKHKLLTCNTSNIEFNNGSRIIANQLIDKSVNISLLALDEAAHYRGTADIWSLIQATSTNKGRIIITSTPNTDQDMFATIWKESQDNLDEFGNVREDGIGRNGFFGFRSYWQEHPNRDEAWKQQMINNIGADRFREEFDCEFTASS